MPHVIKCYVKVVALRKRQGVEYFMRVRNSKYSS